MCEVCETLGLFPALLAFPPVEFTLLIHVHFISLCYCLLLNLII